MLIAGEYNMETIHCLHPGSWPVSVQVAVITVVLVVTKYCFSKRNAFSEFPMVTLDGKSAKETWLYNGRKAISEGVKLVRFPHHRTLMKAH